MKNKIIIIGTSASGKTTFAKKLKEKYNLPLYFMDKIMWQPNWNYVGDEKTAEEIGKILKTEKWIIEGYIVKPIREKTYKSADQIIYLKYSSFVSCYRYIKRFLKHRNNPRPEIPGCYEKFSFEMLKRIWDKKEVYWVDKILKEIDKNKIVYLNSPKEGEIFLKNL